MWDRLAWCVAGLDPLDQHAGDQHIGQPRTQYWCGFVCMQLGGEPVVGVLDLTDRGRSLGRLVLPLDRRRLV